MFTPANLPLILGLVAGIAGFLACVAAVVATARERSQLLKLPSHQIKVEVDSAATVLFTLHSAASPQALAASISRQLTDSSAPTVVLDTSDPMALALQEASAVTPHLDTAL